MKKYLSVFCGAIKLVTASLILHMFLGKYYIEKEYWLICEKTDEARDNGFAFFKFMKSKHPEINLLYVIDKNSCDLSKVKDTGEFVYTGSFRHYFLYLSCKVLLSSQTLPYPCSRRLCEKLNFLRLSDVKKIWLQHGVTKDKLLHADMDYDIFKYDLIVCASQKERDFIVSEYGYPKNNVKATGFPRYDMLSSTENTDNLILIMPTFRSWLKPINKEITDSEKQKFLKSSFFYHYSQLLKSDFLNKMLSEHKYKVIFYPHYALQPYINIFERIFTKNKNIVIASNSEYDVQDLLKKSKLLITDYSSIFFDFAYMKKPEIFFQFDEKQYRNGHYNQGYFDYKLDGFGNIASTINEVLSCVSQEFSNDFKVDSKFIFRSTTFFNFRDKNNSERTYEAIAALFKE